MRMSELGQIPSRRYTGAEHLHRAGQDLLPSVLDFWQWAGSDFVVNTFRGWLAEFLVASDLGLTGATRRDWEGFDLETAGGIRIEVKASGYVQSWKQNRLSTPRFSIRRARAWDPTTNTLTETASRHSDVYVFCLHHHRDKATVDPLDVSQWTFLVLATHRVDQSFRNRQSVSLIDLEKAGARRVGYGEIAAGIDSALDRNAG